jgi:AraC-like DNA-binding protein
MHLSKYANSIGLASIQPLTIMLLERLSDVAFLVDREGNLTYANPSAYKLLECSMAEVLTMSVPDLPLKTLSQVWAERDANSQGTILYFTDRFTTPSDEELMVEVTVSYDRDIEQKCSCLLIHRSEPDAERVRSVPESTLPSIPKLEPVFRFIEENYARSISLKDVALAMGYCPSYLTDLVRRCSGKTVNYWIIKYRITLACSLLQETNDSVNLIANSIGYQNEGHFFRQFRQHCGMTPLAWRKSQQAK